MEPIVIKYNIPKHIFYSFVSLLFVVGGYFMFGKESGRYPKEVLYIASVICMVFGAIGFVVFLKRIFSKDKAALVIDSKGITDKTSAVSRGSVPWQDITNVRLTSMQTNRFSKTYFITILVKNPDEYIAKGKNILARYSLQWNTDRWGGPINIAPSTFGMKPEELKKIIKDAFERYKANRVD
jgi:hypothetical protein